jgi:hypothetical protein
LKGAAKPLQRSLIAAATSSSGSTQLRRRNGHAGLAECRCPLCSSVLSPDQFSAVVGSLSARDTEIEQTIIARFERQIADAEKKRKAEIDAAVRAAVKAAETKLKAIRASQAGVVEAAVQAERERSEKAVADAVATATLEHTTEKTRLELALADALRKLQAKSPNHLGEPLEAALFDAVVEAYGSEAGVFPAGPCRISRIPKGRNGPDLVIQWLDPSASAGDGTTETVIGAVAIEAKNVSNWSSRFVPKLKSDARSLNAEWAILVTQTAYPKDSTRGLCVVDGIVVCDSRYVVPVIELMRKQIVEMHRLKLTQKARNQKAAALLDFVGSSRCAELLRGFATVQDRLLDIEQKEQTAHTTTWKRRGDLIRSLQVAHQDLVAAFDAILSGKREVVAGAAGGVSSAPARGASA